MNLLPIFLVGLMGSVHCIGMCGGIVGALSSAAPGAGRPNAAAAASAVAVATLARQGATPLARVIPLHVQGSAMLPAFAQDLSRVLC